MEEFPEGASVSDFLSRPCPEKKRAGLTCTQSQVVKDHNPLNKYPKIPDSIVRRVVGQCGEQAIISF